MGVRNGAWHYVPSLPPLPALLLARSGANVESWQIYIEIEAASGAAAKITACAFGEAPSGGGQ